jgi:hypothetical protein
MNWKTSLSLLICVLLVALTVSGLVKGSDSRIVIADGIGALAAAAMAWFTASNRPTGVLPILLLVVAVAVYFAATAHARPWVLGLTLLGTFTLAFLSLTRKPPRAPTGTA